MSESTNLDSKHLKKKAFLKAYAESFGNITASSKAADICRQTYYSWLEKDPEFRQQIENTEPGELFLDYAEKALVDKIASGDTTSIIFSLKTRGKKRGYIERQEIEHSGELKGVVALPPKEDMNDTTG